MELPVLYDVTWIISLPDVGLKVSGLVVGSVKGKNQVFDSVIDFATHDGQKMYSMHCKPLEAVILKSDETNKLTFRSAFKDCI
jgi:hypothetical protein